MTFDIQLQNSQISSQLLKNKLKRVEGQMAKLEEKASSRDQEVGDRPASVQDGCSLEKEELVLIIKEMQKDYKAQLQTRDKMIS
mmetsp:Transcript_33381/g.51202  ORF Transcript_33381/g.51202 Transcript_33381/m.51202 type:complete len:84 (+) Transcript_33381:2074-2325(+)